MAKALFGGVEAGGTKFVCAVGTGPDDLTVSAPIPTTTPRETLPRVAAFFKGRRLRSLGIASFGPVDPATGTIQRTTPKIAWRGFPMQRWLEEELGVRAITDTDVNGAALAEHRWGAARGVDPFLYLTVGTGIGGGGLVNGRMLHGLLHPEMGHVHVPRHPRDEFAGVCPSHGACLEGLACGPAIAARLTTQAPELVWDCVADALAWGLLNLSYAFSPRLIVLGGGVMKQRGLLASVRSCLRAHGQRYAPLPRLARPALGDRAGAAGAIALAQSIL